MSSPAPRGGFSIVELLIALVILTVGMLALAAGSGYTTIEVRSSALRTQRNAAISGAVEQLRAKAYDATNFDALSSLAAGSALKIGSYDVWYDVAPDMMVNQMVYTRRITVYTKGPSYRPKLGWTGTSVDTFVTVLYRPMGQ